MKFSTLSLALITALASNQAYSAAFQLAETSTAGLGRAFAGEAAIAEDASVVARNPALMSQFDESMLTVAGIYVRPDVSLDGIDAPDGIDAKRLDQDSIAPSAIIPATYYVKPLNEQIALGFGAFTNFGLSSEFGEDYAAGQLAGETGITTINLNASASYKINEHWSIGAGLNAIYAEAELTRHFGATNLLPPKFTPAPSTEAAHMEGDDIGFGWNVGISYDINENHRLGFSYRSEIDLSFDGDYSNELPIMMGGLEGQKIGGSLDITLPAIAEFSGLHQMTDRFAFHYSVLWTGWSSFDKLEAFSDEGELLFAKQENFSNAMRYAIGATYQYSPKVILRAGIAYDESPTDPNHMSISIPDNNRTWFSTGVNYKLDKKSSIDFAVTYIKGDAETFTEKDELGQEWTFRAEGNAALIGLQYNKSF